MIRNYEKYTGRKKKKVKIYDYSQIKKGLRDVLEQLRLNLIGGSNVKL